MSDFSRHGKAVMEKVVERVLSGPNSHPLNRAKSRVSDLKYILFTLYSFCKNYFPPFSTLFVRNLNNFCLVRCQNHGYSTAVRVRVPLRMQ